MKNNMQADNTAWSKVRRLLLPTAAFFVMSGCWDSVQEAGAPRLDLLPAGVYGTYRVKAADSLPLAQNGDILVLNMAYRTSGDSLLFDTRDMPGIFRMRLNALPAGEEITADKVFATMRPGDSLTFYLSAETFFRTSMKSDLPAYIKPGDSLRFDVRLVRTEPDSIVQAARSHIQKSNEALEDEIIAEYADKHLHGIEPMDNGLYLKVIQRGSGSLPVPGETVTMHYSLTRLNGEVIYTTVNKGKPFTFTMGSEMVIPGLEMAAAMLPRGSHALVLVPSQLAYGHEGYKMIKPFTPLVFEVKLLGQ